MQLLVRSRLFLFTVLATAMVTGLGLPGLYAQTTGRALTVERLTGTVTAQINGSRAAQVGDRLSAAGHGLTTGRRSSANLAIDSGQGTVAVSQNTQLRVQRLSTSTSGARITILDVPRGQARIQARPFTNPETRLELHTPSGIAAVRGTDFGVAVAANDKTSIGTLEGQVEAIAQSRSVFVGSGLTAIIYPGEGPTTPRPLDRELEITWQRRERRGSRLQLAGYIDPANTLLLNDEEVPIDRLGYFRITVPYSSFQRTRSLVVQNPLGERRIHSIDRSWLRDLDRGNDGGPGGGDSGGSGGTSGGGSGDGGAGSGNGGPGGGGGGADGGNGPGDGNGGPGGGNGPGDGNGGDTPGIG